MTILRIDASPRRTRSLSRGLGDRFIEAWRDYRADEPIIHRDLAVSATDTPVPLVSEAWIAAAFTAEAERTPEQRALLAPSDQLIDELAAADTLVITTPMYNYGMPAALKAWVDQIVRINRTFTFDLARGDHPLRPTMAGKRLVLLTAHGEFGFAGDGPRADMDHLAPHLHTLAPYLGADEVHHIAIEYQEFGDDRHRRSLAEAHAAIPPLVKRLAGRVPAWAG